ncbi:MAG: ParB N-terminal domain-containing protein [Rhodospirillales bacterium]
MRGKPKSPVNGPGQRGKKPKLAWLPVAKLKVDSRYQRSIESRRSQKLIEKMVADFRWPRFGAILAVQSQSNWWVIDGQHRVEACRRLGEKSVPAVVLPHGTVQSAARDFIAVNRDRVGITSIHIHHAAVGTGDEVALAVDRACAEAGVSIARYVTGVSNLKNGETMAVGVLARIVKKHGVDDAVKILKRVMRLYGAMPGGISAAAIRDVEIEIFNKSEYVKPVSTHQKKYRRCMRCSKSFWSTGPGHRICGECKKSDDYKSAGLD